MLLPTHVLQHKASYLTVQCKECRSTQVVACKPGLGGAMLPRKCENVDPVTNQPCPLNSWVVLGERSKYADQQTLKLQVGMGCMRSTTFATAAD